MAVTSEATTLWFGSLMEGSGTTSLDSSDAGEFPVTWAARSEGVAGRTNPEELLGAAHSACYSMALSHALAGAGHAPESLQVTAAVTFQPGEGITGSHLLVSAKVPGLTAEQFQEFAEGAKSGCPVSKALAGIPITLEASLA
ncbi:MAG: OsmC family peroxiredoxin [Microcella sp.]